MLVCSAAAVSLVFSFTNGAEWDGPYTLKFKVPKPWQNKPLSFFNEVINLMIQLVDSSASFQLDTTMRRRGILFGADWPV